MDSENPQRSACDRCRGQKLRCVRLARSGAGSGEDTSNSGVQQIGPCERCKKAGAICINTRTRQRKIMRTEGFQSLSSSSSSSSSTTCSKRLPSQHFFPPNPNPFQHGVGLDARPNMSSEGRMRDSTFASTDSITVQQQRANFQEPFEERPSKRRSVEQQLGSPSLQQHLGSRNGGSTSNSDSQSICLTDAQARTANGSPGSRNDKTFAADTFDFEMRLSPEYNARHDSHDNLMDLLFTPGQDHSLSTVASNIMAESNLKNMDEPILQPMETKEDCLNRLSELSSRLLKDFNKTNSAKLSDILSFSSISPKNTIGRVLENSQAFLEILQFLKESLGSCNSDSTSYAESECSYSEDWDDGEFMSGVSIINNDSCDQNLVVQTISDCTQSSSDEARRTKASSSSTTVDMPTTLTILTCYTWLLQTYGTIFSRIYTSLSARSKTSSQLMPSILPGLHIGGFDLDEHKDLQMEILIQVTSKRLERIEETLGINVISQSQDIASSSTPASTGILDMTAASALLDVMFKQTGGASSKRGHSRATLVKQTMDNIRGVLREKRS